MTDKRAKTVGCPLWILLVALGVGHSAAFSCSDTPDWWLPYGEEHGDEIVVSGGPSYPVDLPIDAFGVNGFGYDVGVFSEGLTPGVVKVEGPMVQFDIRASRELYDGDVMTRMLADSQLQDFNEAMNEAHPCLSTGPFQALSVFVATFECVRSTTSKRDSFQVAVASDGIKMYVMLNYFKLRAYDDPVEQFGFFHPASNSHFPFAGLLGPDEPSVLLHQTNGIRRGQWVFDMTHVTPEWPESCPNNPQTCIMTTMGSMQSFDGAHMVAPLEEKFLVSRSHLGQGVGPCDFQVRAVTDDEGEVEWVAMSVGAYQSQHIKNKRNFAFDRKSGLLETRGPGTKAIVIPTPHSWASHNNNTRVQIEGDIESGWTLTSTTCPYQLHYGPEGPEAVFRLELGGLYADKVEGECGDYDGVLLNDYI